jgi:hypothetical protein
MFDSQVAKHDWAHVESTRVGMIIPDLILNTLGRSCNWDAQAPD